MEDICRMEGVDIEAAALDTVYSICEGDMRKTVNLLQSLALQREAIEIVTRDRVF